MIGKLLGHTLVKTTARYARLASDPIKAAADRISARLGAAQYQGGMSTSHQDGTSDVASVNHYPFNLIILKTAWLS
jgi:hypothetical protein